MHLKYQDAERPPVDGPPVAFALDDFGSQVLGRSTEGPRPGDREGRTHVSGAWRAHGPGALNMMTTSVTTWRPPLPWTRVGTYADVAAEGMCPYKHPLTPTTEGTSLPSPPPAVAAAHHCCSRQKRRMTRFPTKRHGKSRKCPPTGPLKELRVCSTGKAGPSSGAKVKKLLPMSCPPAPAKRGRLLRYCGFLVILISPVAPRIRM